MKMVVLKKWDIWWIDQPGSREKSNPVQPGEPSQKNRLFVVISPDAHLESGSNPVCIPVGSKQLNRFLHVFLKKSSAGVLKDCYIWCDEIYTIDRNYFMKKIGSVPTEERNQINFALKDFLEISFTT